MAYCHQLLKSGTNENWTVEKTVDLLKNQTFVQKLISFQLFRLIGIMQVILTLKIHIGLSLKIVLPDHQVILSWLGTEMTIVVTCSVRHAV